MHVLQFELTSMVFLFVSIVHTLYGHGSDCSVLTVQAASSLQYHTHDRKQCLTTRGPAKCLVWAVTEVCLKFALGPPSLMSEMLNGHSVVILSVIKRDIKGWPPLSEGRTLLRSFKQGPGLKVTVSRGF